MANRNINDLIRRVTAGTRHDIEGDYIQELRGDDINNAEHHAKLSRAREMSNRVSLSMEQARDTDRLVEWCQHNLGERYHRWSYRGGGVWLFLDEEDAIWFRMCWT